MNSGALKYFVVMYCGPAFVKIREYEKPQFEELHREPKPIIHVKNTEGIMRSYRVVSKRMFQHGENWYLIADVEKAK